MRAQPVALEVEITDTFCGEANYGWKHLHRIYANNSERSIVRAAKKAVGYSGVRCRVNSYPDMIQITPIGKRADCVTIFVSWGEAF